MAATDKRTFGAVVRREREAKKIGLREMAKMIGITPAWFTRMSPAEVRR